MIRLSGYGKTKRLLCLALLSLALGDSGCSEGRVKTTEIPGPYDRPTLIAVAPALNFSGSSDFDPVQVADLFTSELTMVEGIGVVGVNRVMAVLSRQGLKEVGSPGHALEICETAGCDGIVVIAITEYDPYTPVVGMAAQLYMNRLGGMWGRLDPVAVSRRATPFPVEESQDSPHRPRAQVQCVFNTAHNATAERVRLYAEDRGAEQSALGWRKYLESQRLFLRYCCWEVVGEMMGQEYHRMMAGATDRE